MSIGLYKQLKGIVLNRADAVAAFMPCHPRTGASDGLKTVEAMKTPGTPQHALMISICMVIAEELARREIALGFVTPEEVRRAEGRGSDNTETAPQGTL